MKKVLASIQIALQNKVTSVEVKGNKKVIEVLKLWEKEGIIRGFQILDVVDYTLCIFLKYKENMTPLVKKLKSVSETRERLYIKGKYLNKMKSEINIHYITTKIGLLKLEELKEQNKNLKNKIGGEYKYRIEINEKDNEFKEISRK